MQLFILVLIYSRHMILIIDVTFHLSFDLQQEPENCGIGSVTLQNCYVSCLLDGLKLFLESNIRLPIPEFSGSDRMCTHQFSQFEFNTMSLERRFCKYTPGTVACTVSCTSPVHKYKLLYCLLSHKFHYFSLVSRLPYFAVSTEFFI